MSAATCTAPGLCQRGRLGTAAREVVTRRFSVSAFCVRLKAMYEDLLGARPIHVESQLGEPQIVVRDPAAVS